MKNTPEKILVTGLVLIVFSILTILFISYKQSQKVHDTEVLIAHTSNVLYNSQKILSDAIDNETGSRGFALTGSTKFLEPLERAEKTIFNEITNLQKLITGNPAQQAQLDSLTGYVQQRIAFSRRQVNTRKEKGLAAAMQLTNSGEGKLYTDQIRKISSAIQQEENRLLEIRRTANRNAIRYFNGILTGLAVLIFILLLVVFFILRQRIRLQKQSEHILLTANRALNKDVKQKSDELAHIFERITDAFAALDSNWCYTYVNNRAGELLNHTTGELIGKNIWTLFSGSANQPFYNAYHHAMEKQEYVYLEAYYAPMDVWLENHIYPSTDGISVFFANITEKKKAEQKILKANRLYNFISQINQMIVHTTDEADLFKRSCDIAVDLGKFKLAWIGVVDEPILQVIPVAFSGDDEEYLLRIKKIKVLNEAEGKGPTGTAIREARHVVCNDIATDPLMAPWRDEALARGYHSSIAAPITKFGKVVGAFSIYAAEKHFFDETETALILEVTGDISFGLEIIEKEKLRQQAENLLKEQNDKFAKIAETSPGLIYSFNRRSAQDARFSFPYAKNNIEDIFGHSSQVLEQDATIVVKSFHPDDRDVIAESIEHSANNLSPWKCAFRYLHPQKGEIWLEGHSIPKPETDGTITWFGVIMDISERKKTELLIIESEEKYRTLVEQASDPIFLYDKFGKFTAINTSAEKLTGYSKKELLSLTVFDLMEPEDLKRVPLQFTELLSGNIVTTERKYIQKNGSIIDVEVSSKLLSNGYFHAIARNITERKKTQQELQNSNFRFEMITRATNDALWEWNFETGELWSNETHQQLYNLTTADPVPSDKEWMERIHPDDRNAIVEKQTRSLDSSQNVFFSEYRFKTTDDQYRHIYDRCYILRNEDGNPVRMVGSMMDVTARKKAEAQLIKEKEFSESIINSLPGIFYLYDTGGNFLRWNKNFETVSGYHSAEITTMHPLDFFDTDERELLDDRIRKVFETGSAEVEAFFLKKNREKIPYYFTGWASEFEGKQCLIGVGIDITEIKKAQQNILESEKRFRNTLDKMLEGVQIIGFDWRYLYINDTAAKQGEAPKEFLLGHTMMERYPGIEKSEMFRMLKQCMEQKRSGYMVNHFIYPDKSSAWFELSIQPVPEGLFILSIDITERKKKEEEIRQSEEKRRLIMTSALDAIICMDTSGIITFWNPKAEEVFGWEENEVMGKLLSSTIIPEKFRAMHDAGLEKYLQTGKGPVLNALIELKAINKQHQEFPVELTITPIKQDGEEFFCAFVRDISERKKAQETIKKSEEQYRYLFNHSPMPKWIFDLETYSILEVNEAAVKHYGYSRKQFTTMTVKDIHPAEDLERFIQPNIEANSQATFNAEEWRHQKANGDIINVEVSGHPIEYNGRKAMMIISNDITERKRSETVIANINKELHELSGHLQTIREEERVQIARDIHDELGQQLTGLKLGIEWLNIKMTGKDTQLQQKTKEMIALIKGTIQSVRRISSNLRPSMLDDLGLVAALEWQSQEVEKRFGIMINFISEIPDTDLRIEVSTALFRIYQEALTNAVRHSGAHEINSRLQIVDNTIILEIRDNGRGIDAEKRATTKSFGLLGIKERTFALGGTFDLQSEHGNGTFIRIVVPI